MSYLLTGYRMIGKLFLLCYLKFLPFPIFPQSALFVFNQKNIPRLPVIGKRKEKEKQSEYTAGQIWEAGDTWEPRLVV